MDPPTEHPSPLYPPNFRRQSSTANSSTATTPLDASPSHLTPVRKNSSGLGLSKRNQSFLTLASLNLAHSSSALLGIFSAAATDSLVPTPMPTPPIEARREIPVIEEFDKWTWTRDTVRSVSLLFAFGYAFAILLESLQSKYGSPLPGFTGMTNLPFFPFLSGAAAVGMGCIMPSVDYYFAKFVEEKQVQRKTEDGDDDESQSWDRAVWNMPMRYIGGVIGFAWAASVPNPLIVRGLTDVQRLNWTSQVQLYAVIAFAALALWFLFDRTALGMATSLVLGIGSWLGFMLIMTPGISHPVIDSTGWIPPAIFSASVTFGNIGRKLLERETIPVIRRRLSSTNGN